MYVLKSDNRVNSFSLGRSISHVVVRCNKYKYSNINKYKRWNMIFFIKKTLFFLSCHQFR